MSEQFLLGSLDDDEYMHEAVLPESVDFLAMAQGVLPEQRAA